MTQSPSRPAEGLTGPQTNLLSYEDIYRAAGILSPRSGYGIHKVVDMLNSERIQNLAPDVKRASDFLAQSNVRLTWGPLRHVIGHNIAIYHKNPDGVVIEFYCELDQMYDEELGYFEPRPWHQDRPQRPKVWGDGTLSNWWGPMSHSPNRTHPNTPEAEDPARKFATTVAAKARTQKKTGQPSKSKPHRRS